MSELVFFYGTLMAPFNRPARQRVDRYLAFAGHGSIGATLFDLGIYPAAVPASDGRVWGELYEILQPSVVLAELDELEGFRADKPESSLYNRIKTRVTLENGSTVDAWAYFYNAPLGRAPRIESGDYLQHLKVR